MKRRIFIEKAKSDKIKNPCNGTCKYNSEKICVGCYRSKDEIVAWAEMNEAEKENVLKQIKLRRHI